MVIYGHEMTITVTDFKARCLQIIRALEQEGGTVEIERRGRVVARLVSAVPGDAGGQPPWQRLRGSGVLSGPAEQSVLSAEDFESNR